MMSGTMKTFLLMAAMTALLAVLGQWMAGPQGAMIATLFAFAMNAFAYWNSDKMVLRLYRAREVGMNESPDLYLLVRDLATRAHLPIPKVYVIDNDQPNAFATGRSPNHAAVAATTGLLNILSREELAGVIAHELAHIKNRDTLTMTITATIAGAISGLANFVGFFGRGQQQDGQRGHPMLGLVALIIAPLAAMIIQMAISRTREYEADRVGADISGAPQALAQALQKISGRAHMVVNHVAEAHPNTAPLFIINPLHARKIDNLFSTHPNTQNRVDRLMAMRPGATPAAAPHDDTFKWLDEGDTFGDKNKNNPWGI